MPRGPALRRGQFFKTIRSLTLSTDHLGRELPDELLKKGFELAYFLFPDDTAAINILSGALEKLEIQCQREKKRLFWRDKHPAQPVRRIIRKDCDVLQWLILQEAEKYETEQEQLTEPSKQDLIIRYIKHLVQITAAMSSFYANIALSRLLRSYTTSEAQLAYEALTQRYLGADEYRRAKSSLMNRINKRFSRFLNVIRADHGELRFEPADDQQQCTSFVNECLKAFTPWGTEGVCAKFPSIKGNPHISASATGHGETDQNEREMNACHVFVEPTCYAHLMKELGLAMPDTKLSLPKFSTRGETEIRNRDTDGKRLAILSPDVRSELRRRMAEKEQRRRNLRTQTLSIVVDGEHRGVLEKHRCMQIELQEGANLIEIRAEDEYGSFPLATHLVGYVDSAFEFLNATATLNRGKLDLSILPMAKAVDGPLQALLTVNHRPKFDPVRVGIICAVRWKMWRPRWIFAIAGLMIAFIVWGVTTAYYKHKIALLQQTQERLASTHASIRASVVTHYVLLPDDQKVRSSEQNGIPTISLRSQPQVIVLDLELPTTTKPDRFSADLQTFSGNRTLMSQNFLQPTAGKKSPTLAIMVPAQLLAPDGYYTVQLYALGPAGRAELINRFTFKVMSTQ